MNTCPALIRVTKYVPIAHLETGCLYCRKNITPSAVLTTFGEVTLVCTEWGVNFMTDDVPLHEKVYTVIHCGRIC